MRHKGDMSGMDGKISNRDLRWWLKELATPRDAASTTRPDPTDWESRARAQGWQPPRYPDKRQSNGRQHRRKCRKG